MKSKTNKSNLQCTNNLVMTWMCRHRGTIAEVEQTIELLKIDIHTCTVDVIIFMKQMLNRSGWQAMHACSTIRLSIVMEHNVLLEIRPRTPQVWPEREYRDNANLDQARSTLAQLNMMFECWHVLVGRFDHLC